MREIFTFLNQNGLWVMIIAVVGITGWFQHRKHELRVQQELRLREMEHQQKMKELEVELEKSKAKQVTEKG